MNHDHNHNGNAAVPCNYSASNDWREEAERHEKCMVNSKRMHLDDETVDKLLRIYCYSSGFDDPGFKEWIS